jgi:hypothetical protein
MKRACLLSCVLWVGFAGLASPQPSTDEAPPPTVDQVSAADDESSAVEEEVPARSERPQPADERPTPPRAQRARRKSGLTRLFSIGVQGNLGDDKGIGGRLLLTPDMHVSLEFVASFDYYFPESYESSWIHEDSSYHEAGVMMSYKFRDRESWCRPYLGLGLVLESMSNTGRHTDGTTPDFTYSSSDVEWNTAVGALFGKGRTKFFIESRLALEGGRSMVLSAGVRFGGPPAPRYKRVAQPGLESLRDEGVVSERDVRRRACPAHDVGFSLRTDKTTHPTPDPEPGKALVYVLRPATIGLAIQTKLAIDGEWIGANRARHYFYVNLNPGVHYFCSKSENRSTLAMRLQAGRTYFLEQKIKMGFLKARNKLVLLGDAEGRDKLAECHLSISRRKD